MCFSEQFLGTKIALAILAGSTFFLFKEKSCKKDKKPCRFIALNATESICENRSPRYFHSAKLRKSTAEPRGWAQIKNFSLSAKGCAVTLCSRQKICT